MNDLITLVLFVFLMIGTPGPANLVLIAAGSKYGYLSNLPFIFGLVFGKGALGIAIGFGLATLLTENETLNLIFKFISAAYIVYLASLTFKPPKPVNDKAFKNEFSFIKGLILHPLNPKAWMMLVLAYSNYGYQFDSLIEKIMVIGLVFFLVQFICHSSYCLLGKLASEWIGKNRWFNQSLGILTIAVVLYMLVT